MKSVPSKSTQKKMHAFFVKTLGKRLIGQDAKQNTDSKKK